MNGRHIRHMNMKKNYRIISAAILMFSIFCVYPSAVFADDIPDKETSAETEFDFPDTYPSIYAPTFTKETDGGITYINNSETGEITIAGYRGQSGDAVIPEMIDGKKVTAISESAFENCDKLKKIIIPDSVIDIGEEAFSGCLNLTDVRLPSGLSEIKYGTFRACDLLNNVNIPTNLTKIDDFAFEGCGSLDSLKIPSSVTEIGFDVFSGCVSLILDCTDSKIAEQYADKANIPTDFKSSWNFILLLAVGLTAILGVAALVIYRIVQNRSNGKRVS